jgi:DMSO reductase anchor subunit
VPILSHSKPWQKSACPEEIIGKGIKSPFYHPEAEWPLIIYTVSLQSAAGTLIWGLLWLSFWRIESEAFYMVTFVLGVVGILGATRHLASPLRAPRAILNWRSSRLSRENILTSVFLGLVLLAGGVDLLPLIIDQEMTILPLAGNAIRILAGLTGVTLVGAMSMIYLVPTRPVWNHCDTLFSFYTGAFQIGWAARYLDMDSSRTHNISSLTPRENQVLALLKNGYTDKQISKELHISPKTVHNHTTNIFRKLNINSRRQL